jgi:hypothetical protein
LRKVVDLQNHSETDWKLVAEFFPDRSDLQCQHRWFKVLNPDLIKGPWTREVIKFETIYKKTSRN